MFVALELYFVEVDFRTCSPFDRSHVLSAELVHRFDPGGVIPEREPEEVWRWAEAGPAPDAPPSAALPEASSEPPADRTEVAGGGVDGRSPQRREESAHAA